MKPLFDPSIHHIHLVGIGGNSMVAVAELLQYQGYHITGSDRAENANVRRLIAEGIPVQVGHSREVIHGADLIIHTSAVHDDNPEIQEAKRLGIPLMVRSSFFRLLTSQFPHSIAISGSHGKTTATSMAAVLLQKSPIPSTLIIGASVPEIGGNISIGGGELILNEACEFEESFLDFDRDLAVILNIDRDHLDYYRDLAHIQDAFVTFANQTREGGAVLVNAQDPPTQAILNRIKRRIITFAVDEEADYRADHVRIIEGQTLFAVSYRGEPIGEVALQVHGRHNVANALAAIACVHHYDKNVADYLPALAQFQGAARRFDYHGKINGALCYDDFAHHPKEIEALLESIKEFYPDKRLIVGFQPHTYSRTKLLFDEHIHAFDAADEIWMMDIYAAREPFDPTIHTSMLIDAMVHKDITYTPDFEDLRDKMHEELRENDVFFSVGCGDVNRIYDFVTLERGEK